MKIPILLLLLTLATSPLAAQSKIAPPSQAVQQTIQSALQKAQAGDLQAAVALLEPLNKPGAHPAALSLLGSLYLETERPKEALALLGPIAETDAAGPLILHNAARAALAQGQTERAERYLQRAVQKVPDSPAARDLGLLLGSDGRVAESYALLRPWAAAHPDDADAALAAAFGAVELGRAADAAEILKTLPQDNPRVQLLRARTLTLQNAPKAAIVILEPLAKGGPPALLPEVRRNLAKLYLGTGDSKRAVGLLQGNVGDDVALAVLLGRAQYQTGNLEEAVKVLEPFAKAALAAGDPTTPGDRGTVAELELEYGQALVATSKWPEAIQALDRSTKLNPNVLQAWQLLGRAQLAAGQRDAAAKSMAKVKELGEKKP
ncbi:MAG: tetratricopeptide repeat protein [Thermoanaerobaculia bacterium]